jgi:hypothetical protein
MSLAHPRYTFKQGDKITIKKIIEIDKIDTQYTHIHVHDR